MKAFGKIKEVVEIEVESNWIEFQRLGEEFRKAMQIIQQEAEKLGNNPFVEFEVKIKPKNPRIKATDFVYQNAVKYFGNAGIPVIQGIDEPNEVVISRLSV